jgi:meso-butanediol dehydrogenase / (S,S)-butanediol dehydrogenase / diacetyl reductase
MQRYEGRVVLVTGAGSGIGRATVHRLVEEGATVVAADISEEGLAATAEAAPRPERVTSFVGDVSDPAFGPAAVARALEHGRLDTVVNSAGILRFEHTHEVALASWQKILDVNLTGTFLVCQAALAALLDGGGAIVNVASTAALAAHPWAAAYSASKGGVLALTRTLAIEYAKQGLRANAVCPGSIDTPITGAFNLPDGAEAKLLHRIMSPVGMGQPSVVAAAIAYLGSDDASHVNGADLRVDGGTHS